MITSFKHKGLKCFFTEAENRLLNKQFVLRIERMLDKLDASEEVEDMDVPGWDFHALKGNRKGTYAVTVNRNWRITFKFEQGEAFAVDLEDYH